MLNGLPAIRKMIEAQNRTQQQLINQLNRKHSHKQKISNWKKWTNNKLGTILNRQPTQHQQIEELYNELGIKQIKITYSTTQRHYTDTYNVSEYGWQHQPVTITQRNNHNPRPIENEINL